MPLRARSEEASDSAGDVENDIVDRPGETVDLHRREASGDKRHLDSYLHGYGVVDARLLLELDADLLQEPISPTLVFGQERNQVAGQRRD